MNKFVFLALIVVFISLAKGDFVSLARTKDYKNAPNILTLKFKGISCDEFMKHGISSRIRGGVAGACLPIATNGRATDEIRFSGRCFNVNHNAIVEILELKAKTVKRSARDVESASERSVKEIDVNYNPYPQPDQAKEASVQSNSPLDAQPQIQAPAQPQPETHDNSFKLVNDELLDPTTPFYIRLRNIRKKVSYKVLSFLTSKTGGRVHASRVPTCYKTTDFCEPTNKYVNFCRRNVRENFKSGDLSKEDGAVYLLVNTVGSGPDTCKDADQHCCAYVNGQDGVCKVSQFEEEDDHRKDGKGKGKGKEQGKGKGKGKSEEDDDQEEEEKVVDFGKKQEEEKDEEKKSVVIEPVKKSRVGKSLIVKREEGDEEQEDEAEPEDEEDKKRKSDDSNIAKKDEEEEEPEPEEEDEKKKRNIIPISRSPNALFMKLNIPQKK